jgi:uncharacterized protein
MIQQVLHEDFLPVTTNDIEMLRGFIEKAQYPESNHNLINMFQWFVQFPLWQFHTDNYCLLLGVHKGHLFGYMPLCEKRYFIEAMEKMLALFKQYDIPFELSCFTEEETNTVLGLLPHLSAIAEREAADYIYETEKLRTLSGKKLQKRRNNYNHFVSEYASRFVYEDITVENLKDVKEYLYTWKRDVSEEYLNYEIQGTDAILNMFGILPYLGGLIRIDGKVKAFIIVSQSSKEMIQINIEKADPEIRGLYQAIEKEFLERHYVDVPYANREDDMGLESLRQAKMALNPLYLLEKYRIKEFV